ncbi:hypothetical protein [Natrinema caseinilyticum]|uniref:hypothetical protein n=1 Tax=Natrinema caseinilyticum TaxID=2961570 RepID=UPI0020C2ACC1|nr:hypothetical protein [Natrinema caseinilyticum]
MSTQHLSQPEPEPTPNRTQTRTRTTPSRSVAEDTRTATDRAPQTFSHRNRARLENLIDEWNAAFATGNSDEAA